MKILFISNIIVFQRKAENILSHKHYAIQIVLSKYPLIVNGEKTYKAIIIKSNVEHNLVSLDKCISIFIESKSCIGKNIINSFKKNNISNLDISEDMSMEMTETNIKKLIKSICHKYNAKPQSDERIQSIIEYIDLNCENKISIKQLADFCYLSTTRFAHLFKKEIGLSVMRYLTWTRTIQAAKYLYKNITTMAVAAHKFRFSDEAHFSRTFKNTFGINLTQVISEMNYLK